MSGCSEITKYLLKGCPDLLDKVKNDKFKKSSNFSSDIEDFFDVDVSKHFDSVIYGQGNEQEKINSVYSSSLQSLLIFSKVSEENPIIINATTYTKAYFEYKNKVIGYVEYSQIPMHQNWVNKWKVFTSRANNIGTELNDDNLNTFIGKDEICTETYIVIGADENLSEAEARNISKYLSTKFARFLHSLAKASQDATSKTYRFIPLQDFSRVWNDEELYSMYGLTEDEIRFIETTIKPMTGGEDDAD